MLAGNPSLRVNGSTYTNLYRCYDTRDGSTFKPNPGGIASTDTHDMPTKYCAGGIRVNTFFPT
jgi:hypothetical protein